MTHQPPIKRYDQVLLDLDGSVWLGDEAVEGAPEAVAALREAGKAVAFLTNDVRHAPEEFVRKLWALGFQASLSEVVTVGAAVQFTFSGRAAAARRTWSARRRSSTTSPRRACGSSTAPSSPPAPTSWWSAATTGSTSRSSRSPTQAVIRGAELIGATRDATFPMPDGPWPGTGAVLAAIETAAGRKADRVIGKPEPPMYEAARDRLGEGACLAVGDRLDVDVAGARHAGMDSALVLSGSTSRAARVRRGPRSDHDRRLAARARAGMRGPRWTASA